jgi:DNA-binding response OmpR family regulator
MTSLVLVAEDDTLVGMSLEDGFRDAGYDVAGPFPTCAQAMAWLKDHRPSVAVIGTLLQDGTCADLARELRQRGVPFMIYSGHDPSGAAPEFQGVPWITKPARFQALLETARAIQLASLIHPATASPS